MANEIQLPAIRCQQPAGKDPQGERSLKERSDAHPLFADGRKLTAGGYSF
jgi:hypothetical protein